MQTPFQTSADSVSSGKGSPSPPVDLCVLGGGPCGLALAHAAQQRGLRVRCVEAAIGASFDKNFGLWLRDWALLGNIQPPLSRRFPDTYYRGGDGSERALNEEYGWIDARKWRAKLVRELGTSLVCATVEAIERRDEGYHVDIREEQGSLHSISSTALIDCRGRGAFGENASPARVFQRAWGCLATGPAGSFNPERPVLMDFSHRASAGPPGFLYVLPLTSTRAFVEETVLATDQNIRDEVLQARLQERVKTRHPTWTLHPSEEQESCTIPLDIAPPSRAAIPRFGAAAGLIHPATGYLLGHSLKRIPIIVDCVNTHLDGRRPQHDVLEQALHEAVWPREQRQLWHLFHYGLHRLLAMDHRQSARFFDHFFHSGAQSAHFLSGSASPRQIQRLMWKIFRSCENDLKSLLIKGITQEERHHLLKGLLRIMHHT